MIAPDFCEPITGWRVWLLGTEEGRLRLQSVVFQTSWPAGEELPAVCLHRRPRFLPWRRVREPHAIPSPACACGVYATTLDLALRYLEYGRSETSVERVIGLVSLWGSVIECERGWRGSYAYPAQLFVPVPRAGKRGIVDAEAAALQLADYGVPVELIDLPRDAELLTVFSAAA